MRAVTADYVDKRKFLEGCRFRTGMLGRVEVGATNKGIRVKIGK